MKKTLLSAALIAVTAAAFAQSSPRDIIPQPVSYTVSEGVSAGASPVFILTDKKFAKKIKDLKPFQREAAYEITVNKKGITVKTQTELGKFYAEQSIQMMREVSDTISFCTVFDYPRFPHRGLHFDVSRHFRPKDFILKQIDQMARLKLNSLHFHLVDAAGWRIQIDSYPRLHELGGFRVGTTYMEWQKFGYKHDEHGSGGYYTKDELREIVAYAAERHINVMPEIEMPGHSMEVVHAYPETGCLKPDGTPVDFSYDICPSSDATYALFEAVLEEVMDIFPSKYIHLGGDEADTSTWEICPRCNALMSREGIENVHQLQSRMMKHFEKFLARHGRTVVGWDEIIEGGLPESAVVMSWRGTAGGQRATRMGHDVMMSPTDHCYLDFYQDAPAYEPEAIGGYLPLDKVYAYNPTEGIAPEVTDRVLGVQGNLWTEFVPTDSHFEYMLYPRAFAIAEIAWTPDGNKDFPAFRERALRRCDILRRMGYNTFDLRKEYGHRKEYYKPFNHLAVGKPLTFNVVDTKSPYRPKDPAESWLNDGKFGDWIYGDRWMGFTTDIDVTIDLEKQTDIHYIGATYFHHPTYSLGLPAKVEVWISDDGNDWTLVSETEPEWLRDVSRTMHLQIGEAVSARGRYIHYIATRVRPWAYAWMFIDEIVVN